MSRLRLALATLTGVAAASTALPAASQAAWQADAPAVAVASVPFRLDLTGQVSSPGADPLDEQLAYVVVDESIACPLSYAEVAGGSVNDILPSGRVPGATSVHAATTLVFDRPGEYRICAYFGLSDTLQTDPSGTLVQIPERLLSVSRPTVTAKLEIDGDRVAGSPQLLRGTFGTNAPENVEVHVNQADTPCAPAPGPDRRRDRASTSAEPFYVYSASYLTQREIVMPSTVGTYVLCVYAYRAVAPADPDLVLRGAPFAVGPVPATRTDSPTIYADGSAGTKQVRCQLARVVVRRGARVTLRCPGVSGRLAIALRRRGAAPLSVSRIVRLDARGNARLATVSLDPGRWQVTMRWSGYLANRSTLVVER